MCQCEELPYPEEEKKKKAAPTLSLEWLIHPGSFNCPLVNNIPRYPTALIHHLPHLHILTALLGYT